MRLLQVLLLAMTMLVVCCATVEAGNADKFWTDFRKAVLINDEKTLLKMTKLPLEVRGVSDNIPPRYYSGSQFPAVFKKVLMQQEYLPHGGRLITKTMLALIYDKRTLAPEDLTTPTFFRFHQLEFEKKDGRWLLTRAYLEE